MAVDKKFFVDINLQGSALNNATIGSNSDMTKGGSFRYNESEFRLEYFDGTNTQPIANLADISAVTGGLIFQTGVDNQFKLVILLLLKLMLLVLLLVIG